MIKVLRRFLSALQNRKAGGTAYFRRLELLGLEQRINPVTITVSSNADSGAGTLRQAIIDANTTAGDDIINFSITGTITLDSLSNTVNASLPTIVSASTAITGGGTAGTLTITGPGSSSLTISGLDGGNTNRNFNIFNIAAGGNLSISGVTVSGAQKTSGNGGAFNNAGALSVTNSILSGNSAINSAIRGGGINNNSGATLSVTNSILSGNSALRGGGIYNYGTLTVTNSTISGNFTNRPTGGGGGGIANSGSGIVTVTNSTLSGNTAYRGGGINNYGSLTVTNSTLSGNVVFISSGLSDGNRGGGINNIGSLTVTNSTLSGNFAYRLGGGINNIGSLTVTNSTLSGNTSNSTGGGINNSVTGSLTVTNSTLSGNSADGSGGGIYNSSSLTVTVTNSALSGNTAFNGGGIRNSGTLTVTNSTLSGNFTSSSFGGTGGGINNSGNLAVTNTIIANSIRGGDFAGTAPSTNTNNLVEDGNISGSPYSWTVTGDPLLGPLQNNGGPTFTMALGFGSPAISATPLTPSNLDQRGFTRTNNDIGSTAYLAPAAINDIVISVNPSGQVGLFLSSLGTAITDFHTAFAGTTLTITAATLGNITGSGTGITINNTLKTITVDLTLLSAFSGIFIEGNSGNDSVTIGATGVDLSIVTGGGADQSLIITTGAGDNTLNINNAIKAKGTGAVLITNGGTVNDQVNLGASVITTGGNITFSNAVTLSAGAALSSGSGSITFGGTLDGAQSLGLTAGTGTVTFTGTVGNSAQLSALTITSAADVSIGAAMKVTGALGITSNSGVNVFLGAAGAGLSLTDAELDFIIAAGSLNITAAGVGMMTVNAVSGGGTISGITTLNAGGTGVTFATTASSFNNALTVASAATIAGVNITTSADAVIFSDAVTLTTAAVTIDTTNAAITFGGALDGAQTLGLTAGTGTVTFTGTVGNSAQLSALTITSAGDILIGAAMNVVGNVSITSNSGVNVNLGIAGAGLSLDNAELARITSGAALNITAAGAGTMTVNGVTGGGTITGITTLTASVGGVTFTGASSTFNNALTVASGATITGVNLTTSGDNVIFSNTVALTTAPVAIDTTSSGSTAGAAITFGAGINGAFDLGLDAGTGGAITGTTVNINNLTITNGASAAFTAAVTVNDLITTTATATTISMTGTGNTFALNVEFLNTGLVTLGNATADTFAFNGGLTFTGVAASNVGATITSSGDVINFGTGGVTLTANSTVDTKSGSGPGANITFSAGISGAFNLGLDATGSAITGTTVAINNLTITNGASAAFTGAVTVNDLITTTAITTISMTGTGNTFALNVDFLNTTSLVTLGNNSGDTFLFNGGLTFTGGAISHVGATITSSGDEINFGTGGISLTANSTVATTSGSATGANITFGLAIDGSSFNLDLNAGTGGAITGTSVAINNLTITNGASAAFTAAVTVNDLITTTATATTISMTGTGNTFALNVEFLNTGLVTLGNATADTFAFNGGLTFGGNAPSNVGATITSGGVVDFGTGGVNLTQNSTIDTTNGSPAGAAITFGGTLNGARTLSLTAGAGTVTFTGTVGNSAQLSALTITSAGDVSIGAAIRVTGAIGITSDSGVDVFLGTAGTGLNLTDAELDFITAAGSLNITAAGSGKMTVNAISGGGTISGITRLTAGGTGVTFETANSLFNNALTVASAATIAGVNITTSSDAVIFSDAVTLTTAAVTIDTTNAAITFGHTLNGAQTLGLTAGAGNITFTGAVGTTAISLGAVTVTSGATVLASSTFKAASFLQSAGSVETTFAGVVDLTGAFDFTGQALNINGVGANLIGAGARMDVTNSGLFTTANGANLSVGTEFVQDGAGLNSIGGNIASTNDGIAFATGVTLTNGVTMTTGLIAGDDIVFSSTLDGAQTLGLTAGASNITFTGAVGAGVGTRLGGVTVTSAATVLASSTFTAASFTQSAGSVATSFNGLVNLTNQFDFTGQALNINGVGANSVGTTMEVTNTGLFTTFNGANLSVGTEFVQNGAGLNSIGGNIASTSDGIAFATGVTLTNGVTMTTGLIAGDDIVFSSTLNGAQTLGLTAGAGNITFTGAVGTTAIPLGAVTVTSGATVLASSTFTAASFTQSAGSVATSFNGLVNLTNQFDFTGTVLNINGVGTNSVGTTMDVTNSGIFTTANGANLLVGNEFVQDGVGVNSIGGNIASTNDGIAFATGVTLTNGVTMTTGAGTFDDIGFSAGISGAFNLGLNAGTGGAITGTSVNINNLTITNGASAAFTGAVTVNDLITTPMTATTISMTGTGNTFVQNVEFLNTGAVTLNNGSGDTTTFTGGLIVTAPSSITIKGTVAATNTNMIFNTGVILADNATLNAGTGNINLNGIVSGSGAFSLTPITAAPGVTTISGANTNTTTNVTTGVVQINNSTPQTTNFVVSGGTLKGTGAIGNLTATGTGIIAPGNSPGKVTTTNLSLSSTNTLQIEITGTNASPVAGTDYDQIVVSSGGTVNLNSAILTLSTTFSGIVGTVFTIIDNQNTNPMATINGTFAGLAEGAFISANGRAYQISYIGGNGNDVTLTVYNLPSVTSFNPTTGKTGTSVVITGSDFTNVAQVSFNGTAQPTYIVNSPTQITTTVLSGATTGTISVTNNAGIGTSSASFTVDNIVPTLSISASPGALKANETSTITFTFSEVVTGFSASIITVTNGTITNPVASSSTVYTAIFTPTLGIKADGTIAVSNNYFDSVGNQGTASTLTPPIAINTVQTPLVTGSASTSQSGASVVSLINPDTGETIGTAVPFSGFTGEIRVVSGDFNGDGKVDIIAAAGPGGGPAVAILDSETGEVMESFFAFDPAFTGGVFIAVRDFNGDGILDIIAGAGAGGGPEVRIFNGDGLTVIRSFFAYAEDFTGGVSVANIDFNGDGILDLVTGAGPGGAPHVKVFDGASGSIISQWYAYPISFTGGVFVAAGDIGNDGNIEVVTGAGTGGTPVVAVWDPYTGALLAQFMAYAEDFTGGVRVGVSDGNFDGILDLITGAGPGGSPEVKGFSFPTLDLLFSFFSGDPTNTSGVFVS